jgi:carboxyl-terminal processing protease
MKVRRKQLRVLPLLLIVVLGVSIVGAVLAQRETPYEQLRLFTEVLHMVESKYAEEVNTEELIQSAIDGLLGSLDPHSQLMEPQEHSDLMIGTKGRFGGLGIHIGLRDEVLTVISPLEGTPAYRLGIQAGDRIIGIEGESTVGISIRDAVKQLRGRPGTDVRITIERRGLSEPFELTITREIIEIDAIPYHGMVTPEIGYVRLAGFSENAGEEVAEAVADLKQDGARKFIFDLRNNHGGLLREALDVAEVFMKRGTLIVSTNGRINNSTQKYRTKRDGVITDEPLVVLVNKGSASASEIVSGAIQDWDRGLIVGDTTFGKGTVQTVMKLRDRRHHLKLTTAYWYLPAGRSIDVELLKKERMNKENFTEGDGGEVAEVTEASAIYSTVGDLQREVSSSGGVIPDVEVKMPEPTDFEKSLIPHRDLLYRYSLEYTDNHKGITKKFDKLDEMVLGFKERLLQEGVEFEDKNFQEAEMTVKRMLKNQIAEILWGSTGIYEVSLQDDIQVNEAITLLNKAKNKKDLFRLTAMN